MTNECENKYVDVLGNIVDGYKFTNESKDHIYYWVLTNPVAIFIDNQPAIKFRGIKDTETAVFGDYIVKHGIGKFEAIKPEIFNEIYIKLSE